MTAAVHRMKRRIVVETLLDASIDKVWERTQDPALHERWDIRVDAVRYVPASDERQFDVPHGGSGRFLEDVPLQRSTFEVGSSLMACGVGAFEYEPRGDGTLFRTVLDYEVRRGLLGRALDLVFRPLLEAATEWSFETLRLWCAGDDEAPARRTRRAFALSLVRPSSSRADPCPCSRPDRARAA